ncbi:MAG: RNA polymerase factor sigma-54 [Xanthomonadales bacterium]|nr:RNA polymerase factor sigma-54 [Xanthomonadales bacterium]
MKPALSLQLGQHLALTPQLRQAIRLLALSTLELKGELTEAVETNPLLEFDEGISENPVPEAEEPRSEGPEASETERDAGSNDAEAEFQASDDDSWALSASGSGSGSGSGEGDSAEARMSAEEDLSAHLLWQLHLTPLSDRDQAIGVALIESLDQDGYWRSGMESLIAALSPELSVDPEEVEAVRHRIQRFDPIGVASCDLADCLDVQLSEGTQSEVVGLARTLVREHLGELAKGEQALAKLAHSLAVSAEQFAESLALIRSLDPKPGAAFATEAPEYVVPDAVVVRREGQWQVRLNHELMPRLRINRTYADLVRSVSRDDASYLRGRLQEARWLIRSLEQRDDTVLKVAQAIVVRQQGFLDQGAEAMKPMVMREIAEDVGVHESTVSRVTTRKYLHTPRGTFEFKHFFSSHVATKDGGEASSTAIQAMIKRLVDEESPNKPLSDSKLSALLKEKGILVARRTVAKYREAMRIPPSHERARAP